MTTAFKTAGHKLRRLVPALVTLGVALVLTVNAAPASAATDSYSFTSWTNRQAYNYGAPADGANLTPPSTVPAGAVVTGLSGNVNFGNLSCPNSCPPNATATGFACLDVNDQQCFQLSTNSAAFPTRIRWNITVSGSLPAKTSVFHFVFVIANGTGAALNPPVYLSATARNFTVTYTY